jgi:hypothetical protein
MSIVHLLRCLVSQHKNNLFQNNEAKYSSLAVLRLYFAGLLI